MKGEKMSIGKIKRRFWRFQQFRRGIASFYIVAFSTLILVVVSTGFSVVILSEATRTMNDDLSQSAYDTALSGVEDAKLAFSNYRRCKAKGAVAAKSITPDDTVTCEEIMYWMEHPDCSMVGHMIGRIGEKDNGEVMVNDAWKKSSDDAKNVTNLAYTCVKLGTALTDYRANLSTSNQTRMIQVSFSKADGTKLAASSIKTVRLSWYMNREDTSYSFGSFINAGNSKTRQVAFMPNKSVAVVAPPVMQFQMVQTAGEFELSDFNQTVNRNTRLAYSALGGELPAANLDGKKCSDLDNGCTDRATLYFVPTNNGTASKKAKTNNYTGAWDSDKGGNWITKAEVAKTNDRSVENLPYAVLCADTSSEATSGSKKLASNEFACSVTIELPEPVYNEGTAKANRARNDDTFIFAVTLPYGEPETDFAMEFYTDEGATADSIAWIRDAQVVVDSTGRANDLYRRVETRLETSDTSFVYPIYALQLLGEGSTLKKNFYTTSEYNFYK